jgi:hypothetical protein
MKRESLPPEEFQWLGQSVYRLDGRLSELESSLPQFSQEPCTYENALNEYVDLIVRESEPDDDRRVPLATVSKRYALIQHREAVSWMCAAFKEHEWKPDDVDANAWLSRYGERMRVLVPLPIEPVEIRVDDVIAAEIILWN